MSALFVGTVDAGRREEPRAPHPKGGARGQGRRGRVCAGLVDRCSYNRAVTRNGVHLIAENRRARHEYQLLDRLEAGLVLSGTEVKSLREGRASLQRSYADIRDGELWLVGANIATYDKGSIGQHDPERARKLLVHRRELDSLVGKVQERGLTLVPTRLYFKNGRAKVELALARGKDVRDKRRDIAKREAQRDMERALKARR